MDDQWVRDSDDSQFESLFNESSNNKQNQNLVILFEKINRLYESGKSCLDLMDWVNKQKTRWTEQEYSRTIIRFYQIKPQFRCEKLLMLFMVNYLYRVAGKT
jgi:hypothetical protein